MIYKNSIQVELTQVLPNETPETHQIALMQFDSMPLLRNSINSFLPQVEHFIMNELPVSSKFEICVRLYFDHGDKGVSKSEG